MNNSSSSFSFSSNISYLCPRDPSLRPGELPRPMNLLPQFGETDKEAEDVVKVYLRIKPNSDDMGKLFTEIDDRKLFVDHPRESVSSHKSDHNARRYSEQFVFTKILSGGVAQSQVFRECALQPVKNFIQGENCLVFAYGTTNAGKTFTIRGDARNPGIIPRALDFLFSSLGDNILDHPRLLLVQGSRLEEFDDGVVSMFLEYKRMILDGVLDQHKKLTSSESLNSLASSDASTIFQDMEACMRKENLSDSCLPMLDKDAKYLVYVSFAEIYNENIYDLLCNWNSRHASNWRRTPLQLGLDIHGKTYIKDLQHFQVASANEAYRIMLYGQHNLSIAGTELNSVSSRSHCIFNIKLVKCMGSFDHIQISTFSFCDLAGSERAKKTHNKGERMRESQNINTSLLVLGRCLNTIRANQQTKDKQQVPFRDSKLTRLFKEPLLKKGCVSIIVNVNLDPFLYDETINVLKFSAIAREVLLPPRPKKKLPHRMSLFAQHLQKRRQTIRESSTDSSIVSVRDYKDGSLANAESLVKLLERLQAELRAERGRSTDLAQQLHTKEQECATKEHVFALREDKLRSELVQTFQDTLQVMASRSEASRESLECRLEDMADFRVRLAEKKYAQKLGRLKRLLKKRKLDDVDEEEDLEEECVAEKALEEQLRVCQAQLTESQKEVRDLLEERDALRTTVMQQSHQTNALQERITRMELQFKMSVASVTEEGASAQDVLLSCLRKQLQDLSALNISLEKQVKHLSETVESAADDHEELLEEKNKLEKECHVLEKKLAEKELEVVELTSRANTYQATFTKQSQNLDLLQKVADDRSEDLAEKERLIRGLQQRIEELTLSMEMRSSLHETGDNDISVAKKALEVRDVATETLQKDSELLQQIQCLEKVLCEKEEALKTLEQQLKTGITAEMIINEDASVQTEHVEEQKEYSLRVQAENVTWKAEIDNLLSENVDLKASHKQQELVIEDLTSKLVTYVGNFQTQACEFVHLEKLANDRLEFLKEKDNCISQLNMRIQELTLSEEKGKSELKKIIDTNIITTERLKESEECRVAEAETMQKEIKELLQRVRLLEISAEEKDSELKRLQSDLKSEITNEIKLKEEVTMLTEEVNKQKMECQLKDALMKERLNSLDNENLELRNTIANLEQEKEKQNHQHESLFKIYEDRLKQKNEEMERYKRDAQHCQDLLYKNPTPNKETQDLIKGLREELRRKTELEDYEHKVACVKTRTRTDIHPKCSTPEFSETSPTHDHVKENKQPSKSTSKKNPVRNTRTMQSASRTTRGATNVEPKLVSPATVAAKTRMKLRKQLFTLNNDSLVDCEDDTWEPLHSKAKETKKKLKSPNSILKRSLRAKP